MLLVVVMLVIGCTPSTPAASVSPGFEKPVGEEVKLDRGLKYQDYVIGTGDEAKVGSSVLVHYRGTLENGTEFDSSRGRSPLAFTVGGGQMIAGFDLGTRGMRVGGKRKITIPPELGYGANAQGTIPANSTLIFEVELVSVK
jgi:FKBP-type peptidyl-prolyl cis-trans isomerase